jgi:hypothetical protein
MSRAAVNFDGRDRMEADVRTMSEEKYRACWCPNATVVATKGGSGNRDADGTPLSGTNCIGRLCAHWEWLDEAKSLGRCGE